MRIDTRLFRSILGRRIFLLFVISALVPTAILALIAYPYVSNQLLEQSEARLKQATKAEGMSVYERLLFLEGALRSIVSSIERDGFSGEAVDAPSERLRVLFDGAAVVAVDREPIVLFGEPVTTLEISPESRAHLDRGGSVLGTIPRENALPAVLMAQSRNPADPGAGTVIGILSSDYLWGLSDGNNVPPGAELCVYDHSRRLLFGTFSGCAELEPLVVSDTRDAVFGNLALSVDGEPYRAGFRNLFLRPRFAVQNWTFVLSEPEERILLPVREFRWMFPLVVLTSLWIVLLLSIYSIRRSLVPLDQLTEGTRRIAVKDFSGRVEVSSGDEFEDLAGAFNDMSLRLQRQFKALAANAEIHRAILSSLDTPIIVETAVLGALDSVDCDLACIALRTGVVTDEIGVSYSANGLDPVVHTEMARLSPEDFSALSCDRDWVELSRVGEHSGLLMSLPACDDLYVVALPVFLGDSLAAVLCVARTGERRFSGEELEQARQLADQMAVALSNTRLIEELRALTWGTLEAFARAIDAKSSWTAGHSERVTTMSMRIARTMGLPQDELEILHRGALLHDIGKLGISMKVLDKPGRLESEEIAHVQTHVEIGGRIIEPISAFADIMPIVTDHHERYDGAGYPRGLAGDEIDLKARILAVADTYDAMTSDRPYRKGFGHEKALEMIVEESGMQFDPKVVEALLETVGGETQGSQVVQREESLPGVAGGRV